MSPVAHHRDREKARLAVVRGGRALGAVQSSRRGRAAGRRAPAAAAAPASSASRSCAVITKTRRPGRAPPPPRVAERPRPARALRRPRAFGDDVGNAERLGHTRADPVRRLVVDMVGEPEARAARSRAARGSARSAARPRRSDCCRSAPAALPVARSCRGCADSLASVRLEAGRAERLHQKPRHGAVAGRGGMVRALQGRVERDRPRMRSRRLRLVRARPPVTARKRRLQDVDPAFHGEVAPQPLEGRVAERRAALRVAGEEVEGVRQRLPVARRDELALACRRG